MIVVDTDRPATDARRTPDGEWTVGEWTVEQTDVTHISHTYAARRSHLPVISAARP